MAAKPPPDETATKPTRDLGGGEGHTNLPSPRVIGLLFENEALRISSALLPGSEFHEFEHYLGQLFEHQARVFKEASLKAPRRIFKSFAVDPDSRALSASAAHPKDAFDEEDIAALKFEVLKLLRAEMLDTPENHLSFVREKLKKVYDGLGT